MVISSNMINCKLKDVAMLRGYENAKQLTDAMSLYFNKRISYDTIYPLWDNLASNYSRLTLNRICRFLNTSPGVIFEYVPDDSGPTVEHPFTGAAQVKSKTSRKARAAKAAGG